MMVTLAGTAWAQPSAVEHSPSGGVFNQPAGVTQREPEIPREDETVDIYFRICCQFTYNQVFVYYTTDGSEPQGGFGVPQGGTSTQVLAINSGVSFLVNENTGSGVRDWWRATFPAGARQYGQRVRYKISAVGNGIQVFTNGANASAQANTFEWTNKLAWPGAGAGQASPSEGYPPVRFWKEEAFIGNRFTAAMLDQNGSWWDMYFPTPGGIQGVGSRNEGYSEGPDTFPALLSPEKRGQMHMNMGTVGIRVNGLTHWLSNPNGVSYTGVQQAYASDDTNTVSTSQNLQQGGANISVQQFDFAPAGVSFPQGLAGTGEQRHLLVKRMILTNNNASAQTVNVYMYLDPALNGGDTYDVMFWDPARGAMTVYDKTRRNVTGTGPFIVPPNEYNITTFSGYEKNVALYLSASMKTLPAVGAAGGTLASDAWRDTSADDGQGWIGQQVTLPPGTPVEVNFLLAGAHFRPEPITANIPAVDGVYDNQNVPALNWFATGSMQSVQSSTDNFWSSWLAQGTTVDFPDDSYDRLMKRGLLATALHQDIVNGGVVAGYHNGAYYYVWPRDAMWAAVTLARTGHIPEAQKAIEWMRDRSFRGSEPNFPTNPFTGQQARGFWKQKCTTDGFTVWGAPQIDGTAVFPWAVKWVYDMTGDVGYLNLNAAAVFDAVESMMRDSIDTRLFFVDPPGTGPGTANLVYSNNLWEDQYDTFTFSNANIVRGLRDAAAIYQAIGYSPQPGTINPTDAANTVKSGLDGRLSWDGENTDISLLGTVYPFEVYSPTDPLVVQVIDRINGVRTRFNNTEGQARPLVRFAGFPNDAYGWTNLIDRYWGDGYWGGGTPWGAGPWFLTTMWYGNYYAMRGDFTPGKGDIDNHKLRLDLVKTARGPMGLGAEQIAPRAAGPGLPGSLLYPGQNDFVLQTAWPNAWESMSFFVDSVMSFLDYEPSGATNTMRMKPKLPSAWPSMTFRNLEMASAAQGYSHSIDTTISETPSVVTQQFVNRTGDPVNVVTTLRIPAGRGACVTITGGTGGVTGRNVALGSVEVSLALATGANAQTTISVNLGFNANCDGSTTVPVLNALDFSCFLQQYQLASQLAPAQQVGAYANCDGSTVLPALNALDFACFLNNYRSGCQ